MSETNIPHQSIISVTIDTYERLPTGQVIPPAVKRFGKLFTVMGDSLSECQTELAQFIEKNMPILKEKI